MHGTRDRKIAPRLIHALSKAARQPSFRLQKLPEFLRVRGGAAANTESLSKKCTYTSLEVHLAE